MTSGAVARAVDDVQHSVKPVTESKAKGGQAGADGAPEPRLLVD